MLTADDVLKIENLLETKFTTKTDLDSLEIRINEKLDRLITSVDSYAKKADSYF